MKFVKRNSIKVDFDEKRIYSAITKAAAAANVKFDEKKFKEYTSKVVKKINKRKTISAQEVTNYVLQVLAKYKESKIITSYIEFDLNKERERSIKEEIGVQDDLGLSIPVVDMLRKRYLFKDNQGNIIETPSQMFKRVAKYISLADVFYRKEVYDKHSGVIKKIKKTNSNKKYFAENVADDFSWAEYKALIRGFNVLVDENHIKVDFDEFINIVKQNRPSYRKLYEIMVRKEFMFNSPALMNAAKNWGTLSACFLLELEDDMIDILEKVKTAGLIFSAGGGCGFVFSKLRSSKTLINSTRNYSSGPIYFMELYDMLGEVVKQAGVRDAAEIAILNINHPDIQEFIVSKESLEKLNNFNISISVNDDFFEYVLKDLDWNLIDPHTKETQGTLKAKDLFEQIIFQAYKTAEPGLFFIDEHNRDNVMLDRKIYGTNPCGEIGLFHSEACNLGSINLSVFVKEDGKFKWGRFKSVIERATKALDNVIDMNIFQIEEIKQTVRAYRRIGLGIMGYAEMLMKMGMRYGSKEALEFTEKLGQVFAESVAKTSNELAEKRGTFPEWKKSIFKVIIDKDVNLEDIYNFKGHQFKEAYDFKYNLWLKYPYMRNVATTTIAPTGSISLICNTTSGLEPMYAPIIVREILDKKVKMFNNYFKELLEKVNLFSNQIVDKILSTNINSLSLLDKWLEELGISLNKEQEEIITYIKKYIVTAHDLSIDEHFNTQAIWQKYINNSISKTINLPSNSTIEDVKKVYLKAHELNLKGITVYREGSRKGVLHFSKEKSIEKDNYNVTKNFCPECTVKL